jgi:putative transposase
MIEIKTSMQRSKEDKEKIILDIQRLGVTTGCKKHGINKSQYYQWTRRYNAMGLDGLEDRRSVNMEAAYKKLEKENQLLKQILAEKELESKLKDELLKKKIAQWNRGRKS